MNEKYLKLQVIMGCIISDLGMGNKYGLSSWSNTELVLRVYFLLTIRLLTLHPFLKKTQWFDESQRLEFVMLLL